MIFARCRTCGREEKLNAKGGICDACAKRFKLFKDDKDADAEDTIP